MSTVIVKITAEYYNEDFEKLGSRSMTGATDLGTDEDYGRAIDAVLETANDATKWPETKPKYYGAG